MHSDLSLFFSRPIIWEVDFVVQSHLHGGVSFLLVRMVCLVGSTRFSSGSSCPSWPWNMKRLLGSLHLCLLCTWACLEIGASNPTLPLTLSSLLCFSILPQPSFLHSYTDVIRLSRVWCAWCQKERIFQASFFHMGTSSIPRHKGRKGHIID